MGSRHLDKIEEKNMQICDTRVEAPTAVLCLQFKTKTAVALCHFHFFAHLQKIDQSDLVLTLDKIILSVKGKYFYQNQGE